MRASARVDAFFSGDNGISPGVLTEKKKILGENNAPPKIKKKQVPLFHSAHAVCCLKQKRNRFFYWKIELLRVVDGWRSRCQEERNVRTYVAHAFSFRFFLLLLFLAMASKLLPDAVKEERALLSLTKEAFYDATDGIGLPSDVQDVIWTSFNRIGPCVCGGCEGVTCFKTNSSYPLNGRGPVLDEHIATFWKLREIDSRKWPRAKCSLCGKIMQAGDRNRVKDKSNGGWRCREGRSRAEQDKDKDEWRCREVHCRAER